MAMIQINNLLNDASQQFYDKKPVIKDISLPIFMAQKSVC
jgi:hypothetical protein